MNYKRILELRAKKNYSRYELSKKTCIPQSTLRDIEKGMTTNPKIKTVIALAKGLEVDINEII